MKRLAIYFFYDSQGIVDDYVPYFLQDLKKNVSKLHVVCNGGVSDLGFAKLIKFADEITVRENTGYDAWAYKTVMESYGYEYLRTFDELILLNFTIMGPLVPLREMFSDMANRELDFWGITEYVEINPDPYGLSKFGYLPKHIQSHFIAIRNSLLISQEFRNYWENLPKISSYQESICFHETVFTKNFADLGFKWETYVGSDFDTYSDNTIITAPTRLIKEKNCPIFKRRSFFHDYTSLLNQSLGNGTSDLFEYIKTSTNYDTNLIWQNVFRTVPQFDYYKLLKQNYVLSSVTTPISKVSELKIGLVMHVYYKELFDVCYNYALATPDFVDIFITVSSKELYEVISNQIHESSDRKVTVSLIKNRGRDVSALLVGARSFVMEHDVICFIHDKKVAQLKYAITGENFGLMCYENLLFNREDVNQIIYLFLKEEKLGMLVPPIPNFGEYFRTYGMEWGSNYSAVKELSIQLGLNVPIEKGKPPIGPYGTMFWFRVNALKTLFDHGWKYEDFPTEPANCDGTIMHAIERIYSFVAQNNGYYTATVFNSRFAERELINRAHMLRELNSSLMKRNRGANLAEILSVFRVENEILSSISTNPLTIGVKDGNSLALSLSPLLNLKTIIKIIIRKIVGNRLYDLSHRVKMAISKKVL